MWHTTSTPTPMRPAATTPEARERARTARTNASTPPRRLLRVIGSLDRERLVDQLLAVGHILGELLVGALLRHADPVVVLGGRERDDLDVVLLERLHHLVVEALGFLGEVVLRLLAG